MDRSKNDLEAVINSQKEQLVRYEKRLKGELKRSYFIN